MSNLEQAKDLGQGVYTQTEVDTALADIPRTLSKLASSTLQNSDSVSIANNTLNLSNSYFNYAAGVTENGYNLTSEAVTGTVDLSGAEDGLNWVARTKETGWTLSKFPLVYGEPEIHQEDGVKYFFDNKSGKVKSVNVVSPTQNTHDILEMEVQLLHTI